MPSYERTKGLRVIATKEGNEVGKVDELVIDPDLKKVSWLRLHSGGLRGDRHWVPTSAVHSLDEDVVTINGEADLKAAPNASQAEGIMNTKRGLIGNRVVTADGERLGDIRDYEFSPDTFALTNIFVLPARINFFGKNMIIAADRVISIGQDAVMVTVAGTSHSEAESQIDTEQAEPALTN